MASAAKIPVIDIHGADQETAARELVEAAVEHGFVYIKNRGEDIPLDAIEDAFQLSKDIFALSPEEKEPCKIVRNTGWIGMHVETLDAKNQRVGDFKEAFNFKEFVNGEPQQPLPSAIAPRAHHIDSFFSHCYALCIKLNELLGIGLQVTPPTFFRTAHLPTAGPSGNTLRFLYYPPLASTPTASARDVRAGAHSDYGSVTLLFRMPGQAGLEVLTDAASTWAPVPVCPPGTERDPAPPILVNIGDVLSYWTNGLLRSTVHRVVFPGGGGGQGDGEVVAGESAADPRYSIAFFCHPAGDCALTPVPSERVRRFAGAGAREGDPYAERKVMTADEHLQMRLRASYLDLYKDEKVVEQT